MRQAVLVLCMLVPGLAHAQGIAIGAHGGVTMASDRGASGVKPLAGASLEIALFAPIALRLEAEYAENGAHVGLDTGTDYSLGYLAAPINLRYDVLTGSVPLYLFAGTTVGALLHATQEQNGQQTDAKNQFRAIDVTLDLGGGIGYRLSPSLSVLGDVRFSYGLIDDTMLGVDSWRSRNVKVVLGLTYTFSPITAASLPQ